MDFKIHENIAVLKRNRIEYVCFKINIEKNNWSI